MHVVYLLSLSVLLLLRFGGTESESIPKRLRDAAQRATEERKKKHHRDIHRTHTLMRNVSCKVYIVHDFDFIELFLFAIYETLYGPRPYSIRPKTVCAS